LIADYNPSEIHTEERERERFSEREISPATKSHKKKVCPRKNHLTSFSQPNLKGKMKSGEILNPKQSCGWRWRWREHGLSGP
jgi:hypothetical protein